jgi:hypothetical protein
MNRVRLSVWSDFGSYYRLGFRIRVSTDFGALGRIRVSAENMELRKN